jgi:hypothetical protein
MSNKYNLTIWQGSTFELGITVKDSANNVRDITNFSARMQIRQSYNSSTITEQLTTDSGEITVSGSNGVLSLKLPAERTANIFVDLNQGNPPKSTYVYDLEMVDLSAKVTKLLYGTVIVYGEVTR